MDLYDAVTETADQTEEDRQAALLFLTIHIETINFIEENSDLIYFGSDHSGSRINCPDCEESWWDSWGRCAAGTVGGTLTGALGGAGIGAGVGAALGGAPAAPGAIIGGIVGAIGGGLTGAAVSCGGGACPDDDSQDTQCVDRNSEEACMELLCVE